MDVDVLREWGLTPPWRVEVPQRGTNNEVLFVESGGRRYVVREYQNQTEDHVLREHRLLQRLADDGELDVAVPQPLALADGRTILTTCDPPLAVFGYLEGTRPERTVETVRLAGDVLGRLTLALAKVPSALAPTDWRRQTLATIRPEVPDVAALATELRSHLSRHPGVDWLAAHADTIEPAVADLAEVLPCQIIHGDLALSNLLMTDGRVSAVLDWEIAGWDMRVNDVVGALMTSTGNPEDAQWPARVDAFHSGYAAHVALGRDERAAIPLLVRYRAIGSVVWRAGRWRQGLSSVDEVADRLDDGVLLDRFLDGYAG
jgi:homoserine kinase type II